MSQLQRLSTGGSDLDRSREIAFRFDGQRLTGYAGDSLASALLANGVQVVGRSFKYHRPRGIWAAGLEEPNAVVDLQWSDRREPNAKATMVDLMPGLDARSVNAWPSARHDLFGLLDGLHRFIPAGFYLKTFMWPHWHLHEPFVRRAAGLGRAPDGPDDLLYERQWLHCDVLVVGGGPSGLAAARAASAGGARVVLVEAEREFGGALQHETNEIGGAPAMQWVADTVEGLAAQPDTMLMPRTTAVGYFDHNLVLLVERRTDAPRGWGSERLWYVRARMVVLATGALERPLVFPDNDRPGIMSAAAVLRYLRRQAVVPGWRSVILTNNDSAYATALALAEAGADVPLVVDLRDDLSDATEVQAVRKAGLEIRLGAVVVGTRGRHGLRAVEVASVGGGSASRIDCDLLCVSGGWTPSIHLHCQSGGRPEWSDKLGAFRPGRSVQNECSVGAAAGENALEACLQGGHAAGLKVAELLRYRGAVDAPPHSSGRSDSGPLRPFWQVPGVGGRQWVDFLNDVTTGDLELAHREGYTNVEHLKRYTTLGMAVDQGKTSNVNGLAVLAELSGRPIVDVGSTRFRPPYTPVTLGAFAGIQRDQLFSVRRLLPCHAVHGELGALFDEYGGWLRPAAYPMRFETLEQAAQREALAVRERVGLFDASPLGKILVEGPDAAAFLERMYVNRIETLRPGRLRYVLMLDEHGTVYDDGVIARLDEQRFLLSPSSGHAASVVGILEEWLQCEYPNDRVLVTSETAASGTVTLAGPEARRLLERLGTNYDWDVDLSPVALPHMGLIEGRIGDGMGRIARVSFTGETSFEISVPAGRTETIWRQLMKEGGDLGITPVGIEALMILRTEKGFIHVGTDTDGTTVPDDLGMSRLYTQKESDFVGRRSLMRHEQNREGRRQLVGLLTEEPTMVLAPGTHLIDRDEVGRERSIGYVTSSCFSPTLGRAIAIGLVEAGRDRVASGQRLSTYDRHCRDAVRLVAPIFYDPEGNRLHG